MESAIKDLAQLSDTQLFETVSEGATHIVNNVSRLNTAAQKLYDLEDFPTSRMLRHFATEESAKILVLLDSLRCPRKKSMEVSRTLECFNDHVGKAIYAKACDWRPVTFKDMHSYVEYERALFYLDGPSGYDWIFKNEIVQSRENLIYVDYMRDITNDNEPRDRYWVYPDNDNKYIHEKFSNFHTPASVTLTLAMHRANIATVSGLRIIADIWRSFNPTPTTHVSELTDRNHLTVNTLHECGILDNNKLEEGDEVALLTWSFPLWSIEVRKQRKPRKQQQADMEKLRKERKNFNERRREIEARREPPPAISKEKIEVLSEIYWNAEKEREELYLAISRNKKSNSGSIKISSAGDMRHDDLPSLQRLKKKIREELTEDERISLLALAWFTRYEIANWPAVYEHARDAVKSVNEVYIAGLGSQWLLGYIRWSTRPSSEAGNGPADDGTSLQE